MGFLGRPLRKFNCTDDFHDKLRNDAWKTGVEKVCSVCSQVFPNNQKALSRRHPEVSHMTLGQIDMISLRLDEPNQVYALAAGYEKDDAKKRALDFVDELKKKIEAL